MRDYVPWDRGRELFCEPMEWGRGVLDGQLGRGIGGKEVGVRVGLQCIPMFFTNNLLTCCAGGFRVGAFLNICGMVLASRLLFPSISGAIQGAGICCWKQVVGKERRVGTRSASTCPATSHAGPPERFDSGLS